MNKKLYTLLCLLGLTGCSNGLNINKNDIALIENTDISNLNNQKNLEPKSNGWAKRVGISLASLGALDAVLHGVTHMFLYPSVFVGNTTNDISLENGGGVTINSKKLTDDEKLRVHTVWICFPGNAYTGSRIYDYKLKGMGLLKDPSKQIAVLGVNYPGYDKRSLWAPLNASRLTKVANEAYEYAKKTYPNAEIKVYAHSLGGYPASSLMNIDEIKEFYMHSPIRLDTFMLNSKLLTYAINWENLSYVDNMLEKIPQRDTKCYVHIISGGHYKKTGEFLSLYDTLTPKDGDQIKNKLIAKKLLDLKCQINKEVGHNYCDSFNSPNLKSYDILTGKADGDL